MEELYKFMNQSNATLDLKVGNELATEAAPEGEAPPEVGVAPLCCLPVVCVYITLQHSLIF